MLSLIIAIPLGIAQAVKRNSPGDYAATAVNFTLYSMPSFFLGLILIQLFALDLSIFPPGVTDNVTTFGQAVTHPRDMFLPIITLALLNVASYSRYMRSSALDELAQDYIRLARAKGLSEKTVACAPPVPQRLPADDHAGRPVDPAAAGRQPADRGALQLSRGWVCCSTTRSATRTTTSCSPTRCSARS